MEKRSGVSVIRFWADWCQPCHTYAPVFHKVVVEERGMSVEEYDVDDPDSMGISLKHSVTILPTTVIVDEFGEAVARKEGFMSDHALREWLDANV